MLLENVLKLEGNLSYLFKFAHLSAVIQRGGKKASSRAATADWPSDWRDLKAPPVGQPCVDPPAAEVRALDEPHLANRSLDDFPRIKRQLWHLRTTRPAMCTERPRLLTDFVLGRRARGVVDEPILRQAKAVRHILSNRKPVIHADDLLAGTTTSQRVGIVIFPELGGVGMWPELLTIPARALNPYDISDEDIEILNRHVYPFWMRENVRDWTKEHVADRQALELDERFVLYFLWKTQAASHTVVDVPRALERGLLDLQAEAATREAAATDAKGRAFYQALQIALTGILEYAEHLAGEAERQLATETDAARRQVLTDMARICRTVPARPPETLHEAIQAIWILFLSQHQENMGAGLVVGRLDAWLQPYFEKELAGVTDPAERARRIDRALELCCALMLKLTDHLPMVPDLGNRLFGGSSENQVITLGGVTADGLTAVCDMTWLFLKATEMLRLRDPNVNARFAPGVNSPQYLKRLCEVNLLTRATPSLHNDDAVVPALQRQGFTVEHARDWTATGCVEPTSCGRHFGHTNCMLVNLVAPLEMALRNGAHPILGATTAPRTGELESFASYEAFFDAYCRQLGWVIDRAVDGNNQLGRAHQVLKPTPLLSALFDGPMESGKDVTEGGARYNSSGAAMIGLTDVVDSLCVVKTLVFDQRRVSLRELVRALDVDFVGHEALHAQILKKVPKFGQEHPLPQAIAANLQRFVFDHFQAREHYRGGKYVPGYWSMSNHVAFGLLSGAVPSGRLRGKPFTPGLTPSALARSSLTEQIHTVAALSAEHMPNNIAFNVKVVPGGDDTHAGIVDRMAAYASSYFELGGMQMQFNVTSTQTLKDAMAHPEKYGDLLVRISGYNAYFVELNRDIQLELIDRAEHRLGD
jgi:formate C-acetyltransferase